MKNRNGKKIAFALALASAVFSVNANPIVFLHGWNSAGDLWDNIRALAAKPVADGGMGIAADDMIALSYYATSGDYALGCSVYTPIQEVATNAARVIKAFQQEKGGPVDVVCHSMGGLVFRSMAADGLVDTNVVRRYITLGTPHYGQNADMSYQAQQMYYGSDFLWKLGAAWHFEDMGWPTNQTLCIAGITDNKITALKPSGSYWDGLVHAWSASLGSGVPVRYAYRSHSSANDWQGANAYGLCVVPDGTNDVVFCMIREFFGSGTVPESLTPKYGGEHDRPSASTEESYGSFERWAEEEQGLWALFVQFVAADGSARYQYSTSGYLNDFLVDGKSPSGLSILYGSSWGPISKADTYSYTLGAAEIFGNIPTSGPFGIRMLRPDIDNEPNKNDTFYVADFSKMDRPILPAPGSCRFVRLYDTHDQSEVTVEASVAGGKAVKVPVSWLVAHGLLDKSEIDNNTKKGAAVNTARANKYTGAGCYYFDVDPNDADDRCWLAATGFAFTNGVATVDYDRNEAAVEKEYVHLQHAATLSEKFADVDDSEVTQGDVSVSVRVDTSAKSGFYRPFVR